MDRKWVNADRLSEEYRNGVREFCEHATRHAIDNRFIPCPCRRCMNTKTVSGLEGLSRTFLFKVIPIPLDDYFHHDKAVDQLAREDVGEVLDDVEIGATAIALYVRFVGEVYLSQNPELATRFSFVAPYLATEFVDKDEQNLIVQHLLKHAGEDHLVLMPNNIGRHWVLVAINMKTEMIYFLDPLQSSTITRYPDLKDFVDTFLVLYRSCRRDSAYSSKQLSKLVWKTIKAPKQQDCIHCGHYVCFYVEDIIASGLTTFPSNNQLHHPPLDYYSQQRMEQFKLDWCGYLYNRFLVVR